jgi:hypothetical protein
MVRVVYPWVGGRLILRKVVPVNCHSEMLDKIILRLWVDLMNYWGFLMR